MITYPNFRSKMVTAKMSLKEVIAYVGTFGTESAV